VSHNNKPANYTYQKPLKCICGVSEGDFWWSRFILEAHTHIDCFLKGGHTNYTQAAKALESCFEDMSQRQLLPGDFSVFLKALDVFLFIGDSYNATRVASVVVSIVERCLGPNGHDSQGFGVKQVHQYVENATENPNWEACKGIEDISASLITRETADVLIDHLRKIQALVLPVNN
jgi:hypothetical protein